MGKVSASFRSRLDMTDDIARRALKGTHRSLTVAARIGAARMGAGALVRSEPRP